MARYRPILLFMFITFIFILCACNRFEQETWLKDPGQRYNMIDSLKFNYTLEGMSEKEVIELLGEPNQKLSDPSTLFLYDLGGAGFFGIKVNVFQLYFNQNGILESYEIITK